MANGNEDDFRSPSWNERIRQRTLLRLVGGDFSSGDSYLAARPETGEVGVQLTTGVPEDEAGIFNCSTCFISLGQLLVFKDIITYLPPPAQTQLLGQTAKELFQTIVQQQRDENTFSKIVRIDVPLNVGQYGLRQTYLPINQAIVSILAENVVDDGLTIGEGHHHFKRLPEEHVASRFLTELDNIVAHLPLTKKTNVPGHEKYISPEDGLRIIGASAKFNDITRGERNPSTGVVTIHVIDPETRKLLIKTYFDVVAISHQADDAKEFRNSSTIGAESTSRDVLEKFYCVVNRYTSIEPPEIVEQHG